MIDKKLEKELLVMIDKLDRQIYNLESSGLTDAECYPIMYSFRSRLKKCLQNDSNVL